jgi:hypothetical protein
MKLAENISPYMPPLFQAYSCRRRAVEGEGTRVYLRVSKLVSMVIDFFHKREETHRAKQEVSDLVIGYIDPNPPDLEVKPRGPST